MYTSAHSLAGTLDEVAQLVPVELVSPAAWRRVHAAAARLPAALTRTFYLESRLHSGDDRTDLIVEIAEAGREILARTNPALSIPRSLGGHTWYALERFCDEWQRHGTRYGFVRRLWLEFDVAAAPQHSLRAPGVFVNFQFDPHHARVRRAPASNADVISATLRALGSGPSPGTMHAVTDCLAALPAGAFVPYAGVFPGRSADTTRLCIQGIEPRALGEYLARVGWPGNRAALMDSLGGMIARRAGGAAPAPSLMHLDIADGPVPGLGFEFALARGPQVRGRLAEQQFLDCLREAGLVTPQKRAALAGVAGCTLTTLPHQLWRSVLIRCVNHIKVVIDATGRASAKAYLLISAIPHPLSRPT